MKKMPQLLRVSALMMKDCQKMRAGSWEVVFGLETAWGKTSDFQGLLKEAGYLIPVRNLSRWRGMAEDPRPPTIPHLSVGRAGILQPAEIKVV